jgi:short-subunit dehydrogenase involved in D-alanine esterification of teichoic acids
MAEAPSLKNPERVAVVTGASSGIGLLTSIELAKATFHVIASTRDITRRSRLDEAAKTDIWTRNAEIAKKARDGSSPNRERGERMRDRVQNLRKKDPIVVARAIAGIAQDANPKLRYLVGNDARIQLWMKRILPWKWHEKVIARVLKID